MANTAYIGMPRAGKSYEVVVNVILASIQSGRNVISNIAGLNQQAMYDLLISEGSDPSGFGVIKQVTVDEIKSPNFWLTDRDLTDEQKEAKFIKAGDLVALDEIWKFFPPDAKLPEYVLNFFRMHGHFVNQSTGLTCEVALISQDVSDFHRSIRAVIAQTIEMEKNTEVGSDNSYRINVYKKAATNRKPLKKGLGPYFYKAKYFPLYKSNSINESGIKPREVRTEKRSNVLRSKLIMFGVPFALLLITGGIYGVSYFFDPDRVLNNSVSLDPDTDILKSVNTPKNGIQPINSNKIQQVETLRTWRVSGLFGDPLNKKALLVNSQGFSMVVIPKTIKQYADFISITVYSSQDVYTSEPLQTNQGLL